MSTSGSQQDICLQEAVSKVGDAIDSGTKRRPYIPLDTKRKQIRLLELLPGRRNDDIRGNLRVVSLNKLPSYEALSYTWGEPVEAKESVERKSLCINGCQRIGITKNLFTALRRLRYHIAGRTIWIDAICIDQSDSTEREKQVSIMGEIYKKASSVLVWLGEYPNASSTDQWRMRRPHWKRKGTSLVVKSRGHKFAEALNQALCDAEPKWYERAWIIQEFVLSNEIVLCFGPVSTAYDQTHIRDLLMIYPTPVPGLLAFYERTADMMRLKHGMADTVQSISDAALLACMSSCRDPKDKVYSLLSLIDTAEASMIPPNYRGQTIAQTFARATYAAVVAQKSLAILELVCFEDNPTAGLATWVVDFVREQDPSRPFIQRKIPQDVPWYETCSQRTVPAQLTPDLKSLIVSGTQFDHASERFILSTTQANSSGVDLAVDLVSLLRKVCRTFNHKAKSHGRSQIQDDVIESSLLLTYGAGTQIYTVIEVAFTIWDEVATLSTGRRSKDHQPFWQCDRQERHRRELEFNIVTSGVADFLDYVAFVSGRIMMFATSEGYMGIAPATLTHEDILVLVPESKLPVILRRTGDSWCFRGFAYVHGIYDMEMSYLCGDHREEGYILI